jgi:ATP-binding cassette subfamily B protein
MKTKKGSFSAKLKVISWAYGVAWRIDKKPLLLWYGLSIVLSVLPAIALYFNREALSVISGYLSGAAYTFADVVPSVVMLGVLLTLVGLSARVNGDLVYMMMYDRYYCGMLELLMDSINRIDMTDLLNKELNDAYSYSILRGVLRHSVEARLHRVAARRGVFLVPVRVFCVARLCRHDFYP